MTVDTVSVAVRQCRCGQLDAKQQCTFTCSQQAMLLGIWASQDKKGHPVLTPFPSIFPPSHTPQENRTFTCYRQALLLGKLRQKSQSVFSNLHSPPPYPLSFQENRTFTCSRQALLLGELRREVRTRSAALAARWESGVDEGQAVQVRR